MNDYSEEEYKIFSRLFILKEFSEENLKKLSNIKIGIVGMGGIGCPLTQYLVNSGIKELLIVDGDIVEKSNLNRQILYNLNDIGIFTAVVSDFKNKKINKSKIKKNKKLNISLHKNIDILEKIGKSKTQRPKFLVGFAAETGGINNAKKKLVDKKCDMIVYNKIDSKNKVFGSDYNQISIITKNQIKKFKKMTKVNCAKQIIKQIYNTI